MLKIEIIFHKNYLICNSLMKQSELFQKSYLRKISELLPYG